MPVANIDEAIEQGPGLIAAISYGAVLSLDTQMGIWINQMFADSTAAVFPPPGPNGKTPAGVRTVRNWEIWNIVARSKIEGTGVSASEAFGTAAVIDAVIRTCEAAKLAEQRGDITASRLSDVVTAFNVAWP